MARSPARPICLEASAWLVWPGLVLTFGAAAACTAPDISSVHTSRDSLGITIVENATPEVGELQWIVDSSSATRIGTLDGPAPTRLGRAGSATLLENGMVVIADWQSLEIRVFDPAGTYVTTFGRDGDGPGEFRGGARVKAQRGDTILTWDRMALRRSMFSISSGLLQTEQLDYGEVFSALGGLRASPWFLRDGSLLISGEQSWKQRPQYFEVYRLRTEVVWTSFDRSRSIRIETYPATETILVPGVEPPNISTDRSPFGRRGILAAGGSPPRVCTGDTGVPEVRCYHPDGNTLFIRWRQQAQPVRSQEVDAWKDQRRAAVAAGANTARSQLERTLHNMPIPATKPHYSRMFVDDAHYVWIQRITEVPDPRAGTIRYDVFSPDGAWLGHTLLPDVRILEIGLHHMLGVALDQDGIEVVTLYRLRR